MRKCDKDLAREVRGLGFTLVRADNHLIWHHPTGGVLVTAKSMGRGRAYANALAKARQIARRA